VLRQNFQIKLITFSILFDSEERAMLLLAMQLALVWLLNKILSNHILSLFTDHIEWDKIR